MRVYCCYYYFYYYPIIIYQRTHMHIWSHDIYIIWPLRIGSQWSNERCLSCPPHPQSLRRNPHTLTKIRTNNSSLGKRAIQALIEKKKHYYQQHNILVLDLIQSIYTSLSFSLNVYINSNGMFYHILLWQKAISSFSMHT